MSQSSSLTVGTAGGTFLSIVPSLSSEDIAKTVVLAVIGALVSYLVSDFLKWLFEKHKK